MSTATLSGAAVFENLDRLTQVEMRPQGLPAGIIGQLYAIARGDGEPRLVVEARIVEAIDCVARAGIERDRACPEAAAELSVCVPSPPRPLYGEPG